MQEEMQLLKELQAIDQELNRFGQGRQKLEAEQSALAGDLERVQSMVDRLAAEIDALKGQHRELLQALALEQENVKKAEGRLPTIKTQKEYVAVLKEIDTAKKMNKDIHDRLQEKIGAIESLDKDREEKDGELAAVRSRVEARRAEIAAAIAADEETVGGKTAQREALLQKLPPALRRRYQQLMDRRGGIAVVEARNGACLGCHMHLPPQLYNNLFRSGEVQSCPHCHRLLFIQGE